MNHKVLLLFISILFLSACSDFASGGKKYERITIEVDDEYYIYSCEENFTDANISTQAHLAHAYLFEKIEKEATNLFKPFMEKVINEDYKEEDGLPWSEWIKLFIESFKMQSHVKEHAKEIDKKYGCILIEKIE